MDIVMLLAALALGVVLFAFVLGLASIVERTAPREAVEARVSGLHVTPDAGRRQQAPS